LTHCGHELAAFAAMHGLDLLMPEQSD